MQKPKQLRPWDTIAVISPSWGGPSVFPHVYNYGIKVLQNLGLNIKEYPSARADADYLHAHPEFRAHDINTAFSDPGVDAIFVSIGGDDSIRILPYLDVDSIQNNPKILLGYSDTTTLLTYCNQLGLVTFHGPTVMAGFSQWESLGVEFQSHVKTLLFENPESYEYTPFDTYYEGYPDWNDVAHVWKVHWESKNVGWNVLQGNSIVRWRLFGGCVEVLEFMKGTSFWPQADFWKDKILFLETSEEKISPQQVRYVLRNYGMQWIFDSIAALLVWRARDYSDSEKQELDHTILDVVSQEFGNTRLPIVTNMDFGHTDPQWILPLGIQAELDCQHKIFRLTETIYSD